MRRDDLLHPEQLVGRKSPFRIFGNALPLLLRNLADQNREQPVPLVFGEPRLRLEELLRRDDRFTRPAAGLGPSAVTGLPASGGEIVSGAFPACAVFRRFSGAALRIRQMDGPFIRSPGSVRQDRTVPQAAARQIRAFPRPLAVLQVRTDRRARAVRPVAAVAACRLLRLDRKSVV